MNGRKRELQLSAQEHEILRAIAASSSPIQPLSSMQRLRFEMLGLIEDRAKGVRLTERGREAAQAPIRTAPEVRTEEPKTPSRFREDLRRQGFPDGATVNGSFNGDRKNIYQR